MVKGLAKRVVVVKSPDKRFFEEAIFILREDAQSGISAQDIIEQARDIAEGYVFSSSASRRILRPVLYALAAVLLGASGYFLASFLF